MKTQVINTEKSLLTPVKLGRYQLPNRIVMPGLTRNRAGADGVPTAMMVTYYAQRASAGLIVTEASQVSPQGEGYLYTPGIYSQQQIQGWKLITDAVHQQGGHIFLQLWHTGRVSHPSMQLGGALPVAPSAIALKGMASTYEGQKPFVTPRALETEEIPSIVEQFRQGAENALAAGFDGVEIHGAYSYLIDQFLHDSSNQRTDQYGGSIENRARFLMEVTADLVGVWGADRVGVRLSPGSTWQDMHDSQAIELFSYVVTALNCFNLAYLSLVEPRLDDPEFLITDPQKAKLTVRYLRSLYKGTLIAAGGYKRESGNEAIATGVADLVAYGRLFISNPDLPKRFALNAPLNQYDRSTFYGGDERGYIDYRDFVKN